MPLVPPELTANLMRRALAVSLLALASGPVSARGQEALVPARIVEIAGANLYLDAGTDAGVRAGDTLVARRAAGDTPLGTLVVIAATGTRAVVTFAGRPFAVTRGDALLLAVPSAGVPAAPAEAPTPLARAQRVPIGRVRISGSAGLDVLSARTTTFGLGADPVRVVRDFTVPSLRLQTSVRNLPGGGRLNLSLRASQQSGPATLFDRSTIVRVYHANFDQQWAVARVLLGRFLAPFEPFSGL